MKKISIAVLALAALSTAAFASDNRDGRGYQDSLGQFTIQSPDANLFVPQASSDEVQKKAARLTEKNGTTDYDVL